MACYRVVAKSRRRTGPNALRLQLGGIHLRAAGLTEIEYTFKHALTQEVAYNSVLIEHRKACTKAPDKRWRRCSPSRMDDHLGELAHHYSRSDKSLRRSTILACAGSKQTAFSLSGSGRAISTRTGIAQMPACNSGASAISRNLQLQSTLGAAFMTG